MLRKRLLYITLEYRKFIVSQRLSTACEKKICLLSVHDSVCCPPSHFYKFIVILHLAVIC